jgi:hypothetical protein
MLPPVRFGGRQRRLETHTYAMIDSQHEPWMFQETCLEVYTINYIYTN